MWDLQCRKDGICSVVKGMTEDRELGRKGVKQCAKVEGDRQAEK